ncbi:MAG: hypothetical protein AABM64_08175 [Pseudomonadota bacterium]
MFANTDWYLYNFRIGLAQALKDKGDEVVLVSPAGEYGELLRAHDSVGFPYDLIGEV